MKPTIKMITALAGVSPGTVEDRVLHGRLNVNPEKMVC